MNWAFSEREIESKKFILIKNIFLNFTINYSGKPVAPPGQWLTFGYVYFYKQVTPLAYSPDVIGFHYATTQCVTANEIYLFLTSIYASVKVPKSYTVQECDARNDAIKNYGSAPLTTGLKKIFLFNTKIFKQPHRCIMPRAANY